jgi:hypothetical protein
MLLKHFNEFLKLCQAIYFCYKVLTFRMSIFSLNFYGGYMMEFDEMSGLELQYAQEEMHKHFILEEMVSLCMQYGYEPTMDDFRNRLNQAINRLIPVVDTEV